ncbi:MAG: amidohydrolase family protein [Victivallaceae bacterium]|nr:amidohydrolase family protein [Victivallaceae bacterium]
MKDLFFFDSHCRIGSNCMGHSPVPDIPTLFEEMDRFGVDRALIRHIGIDKGALWTNREVSAFLREDPAHRLTGVWCILPSQCDELPEPDVFFALMKEARVGAITLSPFGHNYIPCRLTLGRILDAATERKIPVLLDAFAGKWQELYHFLEEFPRLRCIYLEGSGRWGTDRYLRPLLENYPEFHFSTGGYWVPEGICDLAERYGANRILFGSGLPRFLPGSGMLQLKQSGLDPQSLAMIAGKNLSRLLEEAQL